MSLTTNTQPARLSDGFPVWLQDIDATLPVTASYVVHGNVHDHYLLPGPQGRPVPMGFASALWTTLAASGFEALVVQTPVGQSVYPEGRPRSPPRRSAWRGRLSAPPPGPSNSAR